jgi:hypothetical protein
MNRTISQDFRIDLGRGAGGKTFMRVVHLPTGIERTVSSIGSRDSRELAKELAAEILEELARKDAKAAQASSPGSRPPAAGRSTGQETRRKRTRALATTKTMSNDLNRPVHRIGASPPIQPLAPDLEIRGEPEL